MSAPARCLLMCLLLGLASAPLLAQSAGAYRGHSLPRLRGVMLGDHVEEADLRELGLKWKANHVRWQLKWGGFPFGPADKAEPHAYDQWLAKSLARLDRLLPVCREAGLLVLIDVHTPPGGRDSRKVFRMFQEKRFQEQFVAIWEQMARRYRQEPAVWGYDLVNEPVGGEKVPEGLMTWQELAEHTARRIRKVDPNTAIIVEPGPWGSVNGFRTFQPLTVKNVVYSFHMYQPHAFTHQGVYDAPTGIGYPGKVGGKHWDKDALREAVRPAVEFQKRHKVHMYVGEFSAIRWAPGDSAAAYLSDVIDVLEENGWDWAYHAFREWHGWSVEHGPDPKNTQPVAKPTRRKQVLLEWFAKNRKP